MGNTTLSLVNFTSIFELFTGYYLLLGTSERFNDYFNISRIFKRWPLDYQQIVNKNRQIDIFLKDIISKLPDLGKSQSVRDAERSLRNVIRQMGGAKRIEKQGKKMQGLAKMLERLVPAHYHYDDSKEETEFYKFIKSFYIIYGSVSLGILIIAGMIEQLYKLPALNFINCIGFVVWVAMVFQIVANAAFGTLLYKLNPVKTIMVAFFIISVLIIIPAKYLVKVQFLPFILPDSVVSYNNFQILSIVVLILLPIVTHSLTLGYLVYSHKRVRSIMDKINKWVIVPEPDSPETTIEQLPE